MLSTTKELNYKKYLGYAGLDIDSISTEVQGGWSGVTTRARNDSVVIASVDWQSPAWDAGLRQRNIILEIDGQRQAPSQLTMYLRIKNQEIKLN